MYSASLVGLDGCSSLVELVDRVVHVVTGGVRELLAPVMVRRGDRPISRGGSRWLMVFGLLAFTD